MILEEGILRTQIPALQTTVRTLRSQLGMAPVAMNPAMPVMEQQYPQAAPRPQIPANYTPDMADALRMASQREVQEGMGSIPANNPEPETEGNLDAVAVFGGGGWV